MEEKNVVHQKPENEALHEKLKEKEQRISCLTRINQTLKMVHECGRALMHARSETDLLDEICRLIVKEGDYPLAWIGFVELEEQIIVRPAAHFGIAEGYQEITDAYLNELGTGEQPANQSLQIGNPCVQYQSSKSIGKAWAERGPSSPDGLFVLRLPMLVKGQLFGLVNVYAQSSDAFEPDVIDLFFRLTHDLVFSILTLRAQAERTRAEQERALLVAAVAQTADAIMVIDYHLNLAILGGVVLAEPLPLWDDT